MLKENFFGLRRATRRFAHLGGAKAAIADPKVVQGVDPKALRTRELQALLSDD